MTDQPTNPVVTPFPAPALQAGTGRKPGTFVRGDRRINRAGRPKSFLQLRKHVLLFLAEQNDAGSGSRLDTVLHELARRDPKALLEFGFGKVPSAVDVNANLTSKPLKLYSVVSPDDL